MEISTCSCPHNHYPLPLSDESPAGDIVSESDGGVIERAISRAGHRPRQKRALLISIVLTVVMMAAEFVAGWLTGSLMLVSDAVHMLSHTLSLSISFFAIVLAAQKTGVRLSYGLYRVEILAALLNGIGLLVFSLWIVYEALARIASPTHVMGVEMTVVAVVGLLVNLTTAYILGRSGLEDLNTKSAFLHMLADTFSSVVIIAGGILIIFTGWVVVDPVLSLVVAAVIVRWSWGLIKDSTLILLERKPEHISVESAVDGIMKEFPEIKNIHDIHIWEITSQFICFTAHIVLEDVRISEALALRQKVYEFLRTRLGIGHVVIQFEC